MFLPIKQELELLYKEIIFKDIYWKFIGNFNSIEYTVNTYYIKKDFVTLKYKNTNDYTYIIYSVIFLYSLKKCAIQEHTITRHS